MTLGFPLPLRPALVAAPARHELLCFDTGLAKFGLAAFDLDTGELLDLDVVCTEKSTRKRDVSSASDTASRGREVAQRILRFGALRGGVVRAVAHEGLSLPRNSHAAALIGISLGLVLMHAETLGVPVLEVSPQELKTRVAGSKSATKAEVMTAVAGRVGGPRLRELLKIATNREPLWEHPVDAAAVGLSVLDHDIIRALRGSR